VPVVPCPVPAVAGSDQGRTALPQADPVELDLRFGPFQLLPVRRELRTAEGVIPLGRRATDVLLLLVERAGEVVPKSDIVDRAWPGQVVDESNLRLHVSALRRILGRAADGRPYIVTIPGRGYSFAATVMGTARPPGDHIPRRPAPNLGIHPVEHLLGRGDIVKPITEVLRSDRLVTLIGAGGVGKSAVAAVVGQAVLRCVNVPTFRVKLSAIDDPALVSASIATALGVSIREEDPTTSLVEYLADKSLLLLFDDCDHVAATVAGLASQLLAKTAKIRILATSREPLDIPGERIWPVGPLVVPDPGETDLDRLLAFPSVQLFLHRTAPGRRNAVVPKADVVAVGEICRRLDGVPLALELAAGQVGLFGIAGLATSLDDALLMAAKGPRTATHRQQSVRGAMEWSYRLLSETERRLLCRLSVFKGPFTAEYVVAVVGDDTLDRQQIQDALLALERKSLLMREASGETERFGMLRITRAYASEILEASGEHLALAQRHAHHYCALFEQAGDLWETLSRAEWVAEYRHAIDDVRAALDWCFGAGSDPVTGGSLIAATLPFGYQLSLIDEFRRRAELALANLPTLPATTIARLRLCLALRSISLNMAGDPTQDDGWLAEGAALADALGDPRYLVEPQLLRAICLIEQGDYGEAVRATDDLAFVAARADDPLARLLAERAAAQSAHFAGDHDRSRELAMRVLTDTALSIPLVYSQASVDKRVSMGIILARSAWIEGFPDRAARLIDQAIEVALSDGPFAICQGLALAGCPIALWRGDDVLAAERIALLLQSTERYTLDRWNRLAKGYRGVLDRRVARREGRSVEVAVEWLPAGRLSKELLVSVDEELVQAEDLVRPAIWPSGWCMPEMMRASAVRRFATGGPNAMVESEALLRRSIGAAAWQGALSWELRSTITLSAMLQRHDRASEARNLLVGVLGRFTEGLDTVDLLRAKALLAGLDGGSPSF
jgi:predicted ATPase/DNA-binding winged helix-turn-helix (wHTH) protein